MDHRELEEIKREVNDELCLYSGPHYRRRIRQLLTALTCLQDEVNWFRDAVSVLGFDAPGGDGVNPLKERLAELLRASAPPPEVRKPDPPPEGQRSPQ